MIQLSKTFFTIVLLLMACRKYKYKKCQVTDDVKKRWFTWNTKNNFLKQNCAELIDRCADLTNECAELISECADLINKCADLIDNCADLIDKCADLIDKW